MSKHSQLIRNPWQLGCNTSSKLCDFDSCISDSLSVRLQCWSHQHRHLHCRLDVWQFKIRSMPNHILHFEINWMQHRFGSPFRLTDHSRSCHSLESLDQLNTSRWLSKCCCVCLVYQQCSHYDQWDHDQTKDQLRHCFDHKQHILDQRLCRPLSWSSLCCHSLCCFTHSVCSYPIYKRSLHVHERQQCRLWWSNYLRSIANWMHWYLRR